MRLPYLRRTIAVLAATTAAAGLVAGCSGEDQVPSIGYAVDTAVTSYNGGTAAGAASAQAVFGRVLTGFFYTGPDGQPVADTDVGTAKEVPGEAQTIQYRLNPRGVYSDGVPTSCDDLVFTWAARSGRFPGFESASTAGYEDIERVECQPGSKDGTVVFRPGKRYLPWRTLFGAGELMPAHVAAEAANVPDIVAAVQNDDRPALDRLAQFWNTGWNLEPGELDITRFPSSGPYRIESFGLEDGLVLVANERWWGEAPATGRIVVYPKPADLAARVADGSAAVVDIGAGSLPELNLDSYSVQQLPSRGIEQLVLNTGGVFESAAARRAFALCVPRQGLFDRLGRVTEAPEAGLGSGPSNSRTLQQDSLYYPVVTGAAEAFAAGDVDGAQAALADAGKDGMVVRIGYLAPDARRAQTVSMIADACRAAGITVEDASTPDFTPMRLRDGAVDAVLGGPGGAPGPAGSLDGIAAIGGLRSGSGLNIGQFRNGRYDSITDQLAAEDDSTTQLNLLTEAENLLWAQLPSIPLFATPRTIAFAGGLDNGIAGPTRAGSGWNMDQWVLQR
ncbi:MULTISPECIES: ABC transporter substrate-binding protein [Nocardia]|uniref:ABC transporter substrate-binding protein n=1 Tax=Nocardia TaxID=1817 RepID=UPI0018952EC6|nr:MULTISPECIES: ABC transporter substrate-binding protein [Nocardia]MBF6348647.1 peptide-binding protein [Nocardia flavorosea]